MRSTSEKGPERTRLLPLDAFRGFVMLVLIERIGLPSVEKHPSLALVLNQFEHIEWEGAHFWDLIQPAFMFLAGAAMPFSIKRKVEGGATTLQVFRGVLWRAFVLNVLSQILWSVAGGQLTFQLINVLSQIALASVLTFVILQLRIRLQVLAAACLLAAHWALFVIFPGSDGPFSRADNVGAVIDRAILGWNYSGYYVTINFLSSTVTMLFGAWAGLFLLRKLPPADTMKALGIAAVGGLLGGLALQPINPIVKRLWTASFTLFSAGWVIALLLGFYWLVEVKQYRKLAFPLVVVGMNSLFIYCVSTLLQSWLYQSLRVFTGPLRFVSTPMPGLANLVLAGLIYWCLCYWLYQRKIVLRM